MQLKFKGVSNKSEYASQLKYLALGKARRDLATNVNVADTE